MKVTEAIKTRRSIKKFTDREVSNSEIEKLIELAVHAPNHHLTQPWRFYVLGEQARRNYGSVLGNRKARKITDEAAASAVHEKVVNEHGALPAMIAVAMKLDENPEKREEDYAATYMAIQNFALGAVAFGLGTHIKTGAVMDDPAAREVVGVEDGWRIVAVINLGEPAEIPEPRQRIAATEKISWLP